MPTVPLRQRKWDVGTVTSQPMSSRSPTPPAFPFTDHPRCQERAVLTESLFQNRLVPEYAVVNLAAPAGPRAGPKPSAGPYTEIQEIRCPSQVWTQGPRRLKPPSLAPL